MMLVSILRVWRVESRIFDVDSGAEDLADVPDPQVFGPLGCNSATGVFHAITLPFE
jgi:hypothetical protein